MQLYQLSSGLEGLTLGNGVIVDGTEDAMQKELETTWKIMRGPKAEVFRENINSVRDTMRASWETGMTRGSMLKIVERLM